MKDITDLTTDEKTSINRFFTEWENYYNEHSLTHLRNIDVLFFLYDNETKQFLSFGKDLNETVKNALTWNVKEKTDVNLILEHLNKEFEFILINLDYCPKLH